MKIHHALAQQRRSEKRSPLDTTVTCGSGAANREVGLLENHGANALRDLAGATRLVSGWLKGLPLQPLIAALTVALILGTIPLMLAALLSVGRGLSVWYRQLFLPADKVIPFEKFTNHLELL